MKTSLWVTVALSMGLWGCLQTRQQISGGSPVGGAPTAGAAEAPANPTTQRQRAQIDSRFFEIDRDFRQLYGKIEALEGRLQQMSSDENSGGAPSEETQEKIKSLETRITTLEEAILSIDKRLSKKKSALLMKDDKSVAGLPKKDFQKGEYYMAQNDCVNAIESFDKYRKRYPKGRYYSNATYNMGECFRKLKLPKDASAFYQEVLDRYPKSKVAKRAQGRLSKVQ